MSSPAVSAATAPADAGRARGATDSPAGIPAAKLEARHLDFFYDTRQALHDINLPFMDRSITALIGPSGCGKSTLLRVFNRMYGLYPRQTARGEVWLGGRNILAQDVDVEDLRLRVGMVFQRPTPFPMSVYDNVAFGLRLNQRMPRTRLDDRVESALHAAALWHEVKDRLRADGRSLSGGQQQRLCIARALALRPEVMLLDEPTASLDPVSTLHVEETLQSARNECCIILVTHNLQQAARVSDTAVFMHDGRVVETGPTGRMFTSPSDRRTDDYVTGRFG